MNPFDVRRSLESMVICVDTREQDTDKAQRRYSDFSCQYDRGKLEYGDYCFNFQYPNENWLHNQTCEEEKVYPMVFIERKMNLDELCLCFGKERKRFQAEMERAKEHKAKGYLLVENATWENAMNGKYRSQLNSQALISSMLAWSIRYNLQIIFCKAETTGKLIYEILHRELKEYLENLEWGE
jgi:ERCC4-type nuclease